MTINRGYSRLTVLSFVTALDADSLRSKFALVPEELMENPYAPPEVQSDALLDEPAPRLSVKAVAVGWLVDIGMSNVMGLVIGIMAGITLVMQGVSPDRLQAEVVNLAWVPWLSLLVGCLGTTIGGYVAAWMGKVWPLRHALWVGIASMLLGAVWTLGATIFGVQETWASFVGPLVTIPAALLGGYLRLQQTRSRAE